MRRSPRPTTRPRRRGCSRAEGQGRHRQRQDGLSGLQEAVFRPALGQARSQGGKAAAAAVGLDRHQEQGIQRRALCRGTDRQQHRSTPCRRRRSMHSATTASCATASRKISRTPSACSPGWKNPASRSMPSRPNWSRTASSSLPTPPTSSTARSRTSAPRCSRGGIDQQKLALGATIGKAVENSTEEWRASGKIRRLWQHDKSVWTGTDEDKWLGWLDSAAAGKSKLADYRGLRGLGEEPEFYRRRRARHGRIEPRAGSAGGNLWATARLPETACAGFDRSRAGPRDGRRGQHRQDAVHRLQQVRRHHRAERDEGLFLRAVTEAIGADKAGHRFIAVTDPGSSLEKVATKHRALPASSTAIRPSADAIRCCRRSGWCRRPPPASILRSLLDLIAVDGALLRTGRAAAGKSRRAARPRDGPRRPRRPRQGDDPVVKQDRRFRRLGRAADRGIHRQGRQGPDPDRRRAARRSRRLRQRPLLHRPSHRRRKRRRP